MAKITRNGYGQVELNQVAFRRDGRVEAQLPFSGASDAKCENGMIVEVDYKNSCVKYPTTDASNAIYGLVYTSEELQDKRKGGLKDFYIGVDGFNVCPRVGFLSDGDRFTTNLVDDAATDASVGYYAGISTSGKIVIAGTTAPVAGPVLQVKKLTTMPDGQAAVQFVVARA